MNHDHTVISTPTDSIVANTLDLIQCKLDIDQVHKANVILDNFPAKLNTCRNSVYFARYRIALSKVAVISGDYLEAVNILQDCIHFSQEHLLGSDRKYLVESLFIQARVCHHHLQRTSVAIQLLHDAIDEHKNIHDANSHDRTIIQLLIALSQAYDAIGQISDSNQTCRFAANYCLSRSTSNAFKLPFLVQLGHVYETYAVSGIQIKPS